MMGIIMVMMTMAEGTLQLRFMALLVIALFVSCVCTTTTIPLADRALPRLCSMKLITVYALLFLCLAFCILAIGILYYVPSVHMYKPSILPSNTVLLPIQPDPVWLAGVNFSVEIACQGRANLYGVPCSDVNSSHDSNFTIRPGDPDDYIYCLQGSVFHFEIVDWAEHENVSVGLFDSDMNNQENECSNNPGVSQCIHLNRSHPFGDITVWAKGKQGSFYSWRSWPNGQVNCYIDRYYYNASLYSSYLVTQFKTDSSMVLPFHKSFQPANLTSPDICFLLSVSELSTSCATGKFNIQPQRRQDILFWPGLVGGVIVLVITIVAGIHTVWFLKKRQQYMQELVGLNA